MIKYTPILSFVKIK